MAMTWSSDWRHAVAAELPAPPPALAGAWPLEELASVPGADTAAGRAQAQAAAQIALEHQEAALRQAELEEAYNRGFDDGFSEAHNRELERVGAALAMLANASAEVHASQAVWTENAREHIVALAISVARHVIARELRGDPHVIADLTRRALTHFPANEAVQVRVHPEDLSVLTAAVSAEGGNIRVAPGRDLQWVADPSVEPGGCIVEGRRRVIDGRVDHALERIFQKLTDD
jgi:flagellar biosynthesis/type III secretory pathway protein FliH